MSFCYRDGLLHVEDVPLPELAAQFGTPLYVYSQAALRTAWETYARAFPAPHNQVCYAVKANSNIAVLQTFAQLGAGFDIVSGGELQRVLIAGGNPGKIVFSGVGKQADELDLALQTGIGCFNVESLAELDLLAQRAELQGQIAKIALRVNPDVDPKTHPYISTGLKQNKFGIDIELALEAYRYAATKPSLKIIGIAAHIGSQLLELTPFIAAVERLLALASKLEAAKISLEHLDIGGGLGIRYRDETPPTPDVYATALAELLANRPYTLWLEPGRALVGNAGLLLTRVLAIKPTPAKRFAIVDAAMNDLMRPALYQAWHAIDPVIESSTTPEAVVDVVGPVCESGDFLAQDRSLRVAAGDLLAVRSAGAYGFVMSSNYNTRPRAAEVLVSGRVVHLARERETVAQMLLQEHRYSSGWGA
jgi:diaminopimelate decarboxylase